MTANSCRSRSRDEGGGEGDVRVGEEKQTATDGEGGVEERRMRGGEKKEGETAGPTCESHYSDSSSNTFLRKRSPSPPLHPCSPAGSFALTFQRGWQQRRRQR